MAKKNGGKGELPWQRRIGHCELMEGLLWKYLSFCNYSTLILSGQGGPLYQLRLHV